MDWNALLRGHSSDRKIGEKVHELWNLEDKRRDQVKPNSIGVMVGHLRKGNDRWWRRPENVGARAALAELLEVDEADLFPNLGYEQLGEWGFPEFPALRPLDPSSEVPVAASLVQFGEWEPPLRNAVFGIGLTPNGPTWATVPDGAGKSFAVRWARLGRVKVVVEDTLVDALRQLADTKPGQSAILVKVCDRDPDDERALDALARFEKVTVLAPFPRPGGKGKNPLDGPTVAHDLEVVPCSQESKWSDLHWLPDAGARRKLVVWASTRVPTGSLLVGEADAVASWLDEVDTGAEQFGSPSNVLWLLDRVHHEGLPRLKRRGFGGLAAIFVEQRAVNMESAEPSLATWLRDAGLAALAAICAARWHDLTLPLDGPIPELEWIRLVPSELCRHDVEALRADLLANDAIEAVVARFDHPRPEVVIARLKRSGVLTGNAHDGLRLGPPWLWLHFMRKAAMVDVARVGDVSWGKLCFCSERRAVIDEVLLRVAHAGEELDGHIEALPVAPSGPAETAAIDAWFVAVGRRLMQAPDIILREDVLHRLALAEVCLLTPFYSNATWRLPLSRLAQHGQHDWLHQWLAAAWAWSATISPPAQGLPAHATWIFPGWSAPVLASAPRDLPMHGRYEPQFLGWVARLALDRVDETPAADALQVFWTGWAIARLYRGDALVDAAVAPTAQHANSVGAIAFSIGMTVRPAGAQKWDEATVAAAVMAWPEDIRVRAVQLLTEAIILSARPVSAGFAQWEQGPVLSLRNEALKHLDPQALAEALHAPGGYDGGDVQRLVRILPPRFHLTVVRAVADVARSDLALISGGPPIDIALSPDALEWLALNTTWPAARAWARKQPSRALAWLQRGGLSHPLAQTVLPGLAADILDQALAWAETLPAGEHDQLLHWWAMYSMSVRPDLVERWWALCLGRRVTFAPQST